MQVDCYNISLLSNTSYSFFSSHIFVAFAHQAGIHCVIQCVIFKNPLQTVSLHKSAYGLMSLWVRITINCHGQFKIFKFYLGTLAIQVSLKTQKMSTVLRTLVRQSELSPPIS